MSYPKPIQKLLNYADLLDELARRTKGDLKTKAELEELTVEQLLEGKKIVYPDMAACLQAGLYLRFNFLDEAHTISQGIHSAEGSYWHAIMHRREPDYGNSKYWYQRVGDHAVFAELSKLDSVKKALGAPRFDPFAFVDLCQAAEHDKSKYKLAVEIQRAEWLLLFDHCLREAVD